jgi:hypothetical protein
MELAEARRARDVRDRDGPLEVRGDETERALDLGPAGGLRHGDLGEAAIAVASGVPGARGPSSLMPSF